MTQTATQTTTTTAMELDTKISDEMALSLRQKYNKERTGIHVSDLVLCERQAAFKKLKPLPVTWRDLNYFMFGRSFHECAQTLAEYDPKYTREREVNYKDLIQGHIDLYDFKNNIVHEIKTSRSATFYGPKTHHIDQLKAYMAITGAKYGRLVYMMMLEYEKNPFKEIKFYMSDNERQQVLVDLEIKANRLKTAIDLNDPSRAQHIRYEKRFMRWDKKEQREINWLCENCPYEMECIRMIAAEKKLDEPVNKYPVLTKTGEKTN